MDKLVGREKEYQLLSSLKENTASSFIAIYGRRRVGKTYLIRNAFNNKFEFQLTGIANSNTAQQLLNFNIAINKYDFSENHPIAKNWREAFQQLITLLEKSKSKKKIVFLDELPWLDTARSGFIQALEHFWNAWVSSRNDIILVVCGSAAAWMINKLINNKGGLHNRITHRIRLNPFTLNQCEAYFKNRSAKFDRYQILLIYMVMGGIPFYLDQIDTSQSADQNIDRLCFQQDGLLRREFNNLFHALFQKAEGHISIIEALSVKGRGLTRNEIIKAAHITNNGAATLMLKELEESHFIRKYAPFSNKEKMSLYQLTDPYSLFYLKWIKNSSELDQNNWIKQLDNPKKRAWTGYAFEQVCLEHIVQIKDALGISAIETRTSSWVGHGDNQGAQIDLIIDRRDRVINLCEMKFSIHPFTITKSYADTLATKIAAFKEQTKTKSAIYLTLISTFGLVSNSYASSMIQNDLQMDILFK
ncbi:AAA family ATPase [Arachidicoccus soli]|uniref:ATP-binding protein n=1 Tax=Arachidicoccus soli TaxID=2341117 RepID=A0A386HRG2_9BACT|nr:ATP-binding protein [Arachidicoccus soli]AYD48070.1 ATP-binding protein [Arachidicoccus soli]